MFEIGNILRETRLQRRIDLVEAEQDTKIRSKYLGALESEDFDVLPGSVYARGFLRTYARYLGLDPQSFIDEYNSRFGRFEDVDEPFLGRSHTDRSHRRRGPSLRAMLIVSLVALAALAWWGLHSAGSDPGRGDREAGVGAVATPTHARTDFTQRHDVADERGAASGAAVAPARATSARLGITARGGDTWVEVRRNNASGPVMYVGTVANGSVKRFSARRLVVTVGAPMYTTLQIPGRRVTSRATGTERWVVGPSAIRPLTTT